MQGHGFDPGGGTKVPQALGCSQKFKKQTKYNEIVFKILQTKKKKARRGDGEDGRGNKNGRMVTTKAGCSWDPEVHFTILYNPVYVLSK